MVGNIGDGISTIDVAITPNAQGDLVLNSSAADGARAVFWFGAGIAGTNYAVQVTIGTLNGRTINRVFVLPVQGLSIISVPVSTLLTNSGTPVTDQNGNPILIWS